jgi:hypothetical protein
MAASPREKFEMLQRLRGLLTAVAVCFAASPVFADDSMVACLQEKLLVSNVKLADKIDMITRYFTFDLTNHLSFAIAGLYIRTVVKSEGRTVPWIDDTMSFDIAGGVEPGETRTIKGYGLSMVPQDMPQKVDLSISVLDAADPDKHPIDGANMFVGWLADKSPLGCT